MYASQEMCPGICVFMSPLSIIFLAHFVQLVPFGQLGENLGVGHAVKHLHVKIQNFIVNIYQNFIDCNWKEVTCTHVMCDGVSVNVYSVYFNIIKIFANLFVWGISNQYYILITLIIYNLYLYECICISLINALIYCM